MRFGGEAGNPPRAVLMMQENQGRPGGFRYARGYNDYLFRKRKEASLCWRPLESGDGSWLGWLL